MKCAVIGLGDFGRAVAIGLARAGGEVIAVDRSKNYFELAEGFSLVEVQAPPRVVGKSLRELDLRQRFRVNLVAIKRTELTAGGGQLIKEFKPVPSPDDVILENDLLALAGSVLDLATFMGDNS